MTDSTPADVESIETIQPVQTPRLKLVSMPVPFMEALARHDLDAASREIGATAPAWMAEELEHFLKFRLAQLSVDPSIRLWLGRAVILDGQDGNRQVVGSIGFHGPPDDQGRLEVGYSVAPPYRRRGFAAESIRALFDWAYRTHGITRFVASIAPTNEASLRLAEQFGFVKVGEQMDDVDGLEYVFETTWPRPMAERARGNGEQPAK